MRRATKYFHEMEALRLAPSCQDEKADGKTLHRVDVGLRSGMQDLRAIGRQAVCKAVGKADHSGGTVGRIE